MAPLMVRLGDDVERKKIVYFSLWKGAEVLQEKLKIQQRADKQKSAESLEQLSDMSVWAIWVLRMIHVTWLNGFKDHLRLLCSLIYISSNLTEVCHIFGSYQQKTCIF